MWNKFSQGREWIDVNFGVNKLYYELCSLGLFWEPYRKPPAKKAFMKYFNSVDIVTGEEILIIADQALKEETC